MNERFDDNAAQQGFRFASRSAEHGFTSFDRSAQQGFTFGSRSAEHGFTLIELMIALLIFGMIASAAIGLLNFSVRAQAVTALRLDELAGERRLSALLTADLAQAVPRLRRDSGGTVMPAFEGGKGTMLMSYVRAGWSNSGGAARSGLQHVEWRLEGGRLERVAQPFVDGSIAGTPVVMADRVSRATVRFRAVSDWRGDWTPTDPAALPRAVELVVSRGGAPAITRRFVVGTGY
ncbi:MAG: type II secretion system minor pseudopilin GspJ [Sphingomonadaceae bacterium]